MPECTVCGNNDVFSEEFVCKVCSRVSRTFYTYSVRLIFPDRNTLSTKDKRAFREAARRFSRTSSRTFASFKRIIDLSTIEYEENVLTFNLLYYRDFLKLKQPEGLFRPLLSTLRDLMGLEEHYDYKKIFFVSWVKDSSGEVIWSEFEAKSIYEERYRQSQAVEQNSEQNSEGDLSDRDLLFYISELLTNSSLYNQEIVDKLRKIMEEEYFPGRRKDA